MKPIECRPAGPAAQLERFSEICRVLWTLCFITTVSYVCPPVGVVLIFVMAWKHARPTQRTSGTHGTARFATLNEMLCRGCLFQDAGVFLGKAVNLMPFSWCYRMWALLTFSPRRSGAAVAIATTARRRQKPVIVRLPDDVPHVAVYGASGSGKSTCFAMQTLLQCLSSMIVLDPKGELARRSARHRAERLDHEIIIIDPFNVSDGCGFVPQQFNPLDCFRGNPRHTVDEARRLANAVIVKTGKESDLFWNDASSTVITGKLSFLLSETQETSLNTLREITSSPTLTQQTIQYMQGSDACHGMLRRLANEIDGLEGKTRASVYSVTNNHLSFLDSLPIAESLATSTFDPQVLINGRATLYLCLPVDRITEMAGLQRVILSTLINLVFAAGEDPHRRVQLLLDEAASLAEMTSLDNCIHFGRGFGLRSMLLFQSASQVERCFPESKRADFNATVARVFCSSDDLVTAKEVSESMGQTTVMGLTQQSGINDGHTGSTGIHDHTTNVSCGSSSSNSFAETGRALMTPAEVMRLPRHLAIALLPGMPPALLEKMPYYRRAGRGAVVRLLGALFDVAFVIVTLGMVAAIAWGFTSGWEEPFVVRLRESAGSFWR